MTTSKNYRAFLLCLMAVLLTVCAADAFGQGNGDVDLFDYNISIGSIPSPSPFETGFQRVATGETLRCSTDPPLSTNFPSGNDFAQYWFGVANLDAPFNSTTTPLFGNAAGLGPFLGAPDVLNNPGNHYHSLDLGAGPNAPSPVVTARVQNNSRVSVDVRTDVPNSRFAGGSVHIAPQGKITGGVIDDKKNHKSASVGIVTFEETYRVTPGAIGKSLGGALAFDVTLPLADLAAGQVPGAAAVSLTTTLIPGQNVLIEDENGQVSDYSCLTLGSIVASVSAGVSDGKDNLNSGPKENFFGNADVGAIVDGDFFSLDGAVTISSKLSGSTESYSVAGTWVSPKLKFSAPLSQDIYVTARHTLTMIADPGAEIALRALTQDEFNVLPNSADAFLIASGTLVPEPTTLSLAGLALMALGCTVRKRR